MEPAPGPEGAKSSGVELEPPAPRNTGFETECERLRVVFDLFDLDGEGLIRLEDFCQIASSYGAEQVGSWMYRMIERQKCKFNVYQGRQELKLVLMNMLYLTLIGMLSTIWLG
eukprot:g34550.t1